MNARVVASLTPDPLVAFADTEVFTDLKATKSVSLHDQAKVANLAQDSINFYAPQNNTFN
jgi:hypothetical protein